MGARSRYRLFAAQRYFELGIGPKVGERVGQKGWSVEAYADALPKPCLDCVAVAEASHAGPATGLFHYFLFEPRAGLVALCEAGNIAYGGNDTTFVPYNNVPVEGARWSLFHSGGMYLNKLPRDARAEIVQAKDIPASAIDGVCARLHCPDVVTDLKDNPAGRAMDLGGSVHAAIPDSSACLSVWEGQAVLFWHWGDYSYPQYGGAFRRECGHLAR